ncbi:MAG: CoA-transferase [Tetrasphaera sp.]|nr:CoA-transferase [Tetrasphaera sp.]
MNSVTTGTDSAGSTAERGPVTRAEYCAIATAEAFRDNGEIIGSAFGTIPAIGVRLARATFSPDLMISDGEASMVTGEGAIFRPPTGAVEAYAPFRTIFDLLWTGRRHVMMVPSQVDRYGNANISAIGDFAKPTVQLLGVRGAPGNSVSHRSSYWVPKHSARIFVDRVDMVCGVGTDKAAANPSVARHFVPGLVLTNLGTFDLLGDVGPAGGTTMRVVALHPGVTVEEVRAATGFELEVPDEVPVTREPTDEELRLIREVLDPRDLRSREVPEPAPAGSPSGANP